MNAKAGPVILQSVLGLVSWSISLINYVVDELFSLGNALKDHGQIPGTDVSFLNAKGRNPIEVHLLFSDRGLNFSQSAKGTLRRSLSS